MLSITQGHNVRHLMRMSTAARSAPPSSACRSTATVIVFDSSVSLPTTYRRAGVACRTINIVSFGMRQTTDRRCHCSGRAAAAGPLRHGPRMAAWLVLAVMWTSQPRAYAEIDIIFNPHPALTSSLRSVRKLQMLDSSVGIAMTRSLILRTSDNGRSWETAFERQVLERWEYSIDFSVNDRGDGLMITERAMYATTDTGRSWVEVPTSDRPNWQNNAYFRVDVRNSGLQRLVTYSGAVFERASAATAWVADSARFIHPPRDVAFVSDTSMYALPLSSWPGLMWRSGRNTYSYDTTAPSGFTISVEDSIGLINSEYELCISRDGCRSWETPPFQVSACSLALVKGTCLLVVTDYGLYHSTDAGETWTGPIVVGILGINAVHLYECDAFVGFADGTRVASLRSVNGIRAPVVSVQTAEDTDVARNDFRVCYSDEDLEPVVAALPPNARLSAYDYMGRSIVSVPHSGTSSIQVLDAIATAQSHIVAVVVEYDGVTRRVFVIKNQ
jgi:photosystem II stability/assembly factor-like uncharacterized protein